MRIRVPKSLLSLASPVFSEMFSVPQPNSSPDSDTPTDLPIDLSEPTKTIKLILTLCPTYSPFMSLHINSLSDITNLLQAADKCDIKTMHFTHLLNPSFLKTSHSKCMPLRANMGLTILLCLLLNMSFGIHCYK